jgi:hypothetical protein
MVTCAIFAKALSPKPLVLSDFRSHFHIPAIPLNKGCVKNRSQINLKTAVKEPVKMTYFDVSRSSDSFIKPLCDSHVFLGDEQSCAVTPSLPQMSRRPKLDRRLGRSWCCPSCGLRSIGQTNPGLAPRYRTGYARRSSISSDGAGGG